MKKMQQFSHDKMREMINEEYDWTEKISITKELVVARDVPVIHVLEKVITTSVIMREMHVVIVKRGGGDIVLNLREIHVEAGDLVFLGEGGMVQWKHIEENTIVAVMSLSYAFFNLVFGNVLPKAFDGRQRDFHMHLLPADLAFLDNIHNLLHTNIYTKDHSDHVTQSLISAFLWHIDMLWSKDEELRWVGQTREQRLFAEFLQLVSKYAPEKHYIDFYAARLFLSPRYMSTLVKKVSGRSAKEWIDDAIVARIKVTLKYTDKQVCQISDEMNFPNTSFFSKFFKRLTGMTPLQYRLG